MAKFNFEVAGPILAICYDFDKTLSPDDMQTYGYIQSLGFNVDVFWEEANRLAKKHEMDSNLAYMYLMLQHSKGIFSVTKEALADFGSRVSLFQGVEGWFQRINRYGKQKGVTIEHYIISSGIKEMIEGTEIARYFTKIYASSFMFDKDGTAIWPAQAINYTNKTQFLYRINKGTLDINDAAVNNYLGYEDRRIPFRNIVYIGDSLTDIPCMRLVKANGGYSIAVYNPETEQKEKVYQLICEERIEYFCEANYQDNSELDQLIKAIIDKAATDEILVRKHIENIEEGKEKYKHEK